MALTFRPIIELIYKQIREVLALKMLGIVFTKVQVNWPQIIGKNEVILERPILLYIVEWLVNNYS